MGSLSTRTRAAPMSEVWNPVEVEQWMPVADTDGYYEISSFGQLRSVDRIVRRSDGRTRRFQGKTIRPGVMPTGHLTVCLGINGKRKTTQIHRLVAGAFLGPRPDGMEVRHLDGNPQNNRLGNLAYGTRSENRIDRVRHGVDHNARKTHCKHGHEFTTSNTYQRPGGGRRCRRCKANQQARKASR